MHPLHLHILLPGKRPLFQQTHYNVVARTMLHATPMLVISIGLSALATGFCVGFWSRRGLYINEEGLGGLAASERPTTVVNGQPIDMVKCLERHR